MGNRPEMKFRSGAVEAAIFVNEVRDGDGKNLEVRNTTLQKRYKDSDGNWQSTSSFKKKDLADVETVARAVREYLTLKQYDEAGNLME